VAAEQGRPSTQLEMMPAAANQCSCADAAPSELLLANTLRSQAPPLYPGARHAPTTAPLARMRDYIPATVMCSGPPEQSEVTQSETLEQLLVRRFVALLGSAWKPHARKM